MSTWISINDGLPDEDKDVLVCVQFGTSLRIAVAGRFRGWRDGPVGWYSYELPEKEVRGITHWMPLPELPKP